MSPESILVLAGGQGSHLRPLTENLHKLRRPVSPVRCLTSAPHSDEADIKLREKSHELRGATAPARDLWAMANLGKMGTL